MRRAIVKAFAMMRQIKTATDIASFFLSRPFMGVSQPNLQHYAH